MSTILVVEDDPLLADAVRDTLTERGYAVLSCNNADEAFVHLQEKAVALIFLDIMIKGPIDGIGILKYIKQMGSTTHDIPVIMLTNFGQMEEIERAREIGAVDYLVKANIDLDRIAEIADRTLGKQQF